MGRQVVLNEPAYVNTRQLLLRSEVGYQDLLTDGVVATPQTLGDSV